MEFLENKPLLIVALLWSLPWKGYALWKAAKKEDKWWFIPLLVVNTFGLLEIAYIFYFSEKTKTKKQIPNL
ncbi:hypothetical protein A3A21_02205 [Candidatus Jorgensenbacteria bacterium RIFCSPLOWO2_01_FULL_45_25b]|uniref:DUF5652 domain-containing protein n=1 Tax=Candidatus Jorgensenbacteria bacterium RIFCSPLOWO2_01_FULL_45_25b TaxID=1798471 RepID=A0A1F6BYJ3_9BACT|nr:MAG: hypothetical protein A3A21_02205 [Candidatus Jorgensenbacteria bacterium RIFCSPLOWO2_01_FULL_45_25b]